MGPGVDDPGPEELFNFLAEAFPNTSEAPVLAGDGPGECMKCMGYYTEATDGAVARVPRGGVVLTGAQGRVLRQIKRRGSLSERGSPFKGLCVRGQRRGLT